MACKHMLVHYYTKRSYAYLVLIHLCMPDLSKLANLCVATLSMSASSLHFTVLCIIVPASKDVCIINFYSTHSSPHINNSYTALSQFLGSYATDRVKVEWAYVYVQQ